MNVPVGTKPALWGALAGAAALAFLGFTWGGWITGTKAAASADERVSIAVVDVMAPICVERFKRASDGAARLTELKAMDSWSRGEYVEKAGWAATTPTTPSERTLAVANACAALLLTD